jgi:copper chaperone CopZ
VCLLSAAAGFLAGLGCQSSGPAGGPDGKSAPAKPSDAVPERKGDGQWAGLVELKITGMHCEAGCGTKVKEALQTAAGKDAKVMLDFENKLVVVRGERLDVDRLVKSVKDAGFKAERQ